MKVRIGIMPEQLIRTRVIAIAQGKYKPSEDEPKIWYTSLNAISQILNPENIALLRLMDTERPASVSSLAELSGRKKSNLSNTLKSLCDKGFARLEKVLIPSVILEEVDGLSLEDCEALGFEFVCTSPKLINLLSA